MTVNASGDTFQQSGIRFGPRYGDAFGATLLACYEAGGVPGVVQSPIERDDGFLDAIDAAVFFLPPEAWQPSMRDALDRAQGRVLDIGAGAGRHALPLQDRGREVVALDVSPLAAEICRRRGVQQVVLGSVEELVHRGSEPFDTFLLMGNNLGLLESAEAAPRFLAALAQLAAPNALIIGEGRDPYATANPLHIAYHARNRVMGRMGGQIRMRVRFRDMATDWFDYLFASREELEGLLAGTGWRLEDFAPDAEGYHAFIRR